jgi:hypothetical protein
MPTTVEDFVSPGGIVKRSSATALPACAETIAKTFGLAAATRCSCLAAKKSTIIGMAPLGPGSDAGALSIGLPGLLDGAALLQEVGDEPAGQGPDQTDAPAGEHVGGIVGAKIDSAQPDQDRDQQGH